MLAKNRLGVDYGPILTGLSQLVHVGNYTELLKTMRPDSIPRMAAFISQSYVQARHTCKINPGTEVFESVWDGDDSRDLCLKNHMQFSYACLGGLAHESNQHAGLE
jgi:hypothetical protein